MHSSSYNLVKELVTQYYCGGSVADIGSAIVENQDMSYRDFFKKEDYVGVDISHGNNVDIICNLEKNSLDNKVSFIVCGQVLEHVRKPWVFFENIEKSLIKHGTAIIVAPSAGQYHAYPYDCYRFFSDGLIALAEHAGLRIIVSGQLHTPPWCDSFIVVQKC